MNISPIQARALSILRLLAEEKNGVTLKELEDRLGPGTYAAMGHCYAHGLVNCTSMPGDRAEDIARIGHGESLPARAVYRTFTITRGGRKVIRDEVHDE